MALTVSCPFSPLVDGFDDGDGEGEGEGVDVVLEVRSG